MGKQMIAIVLAFFTVAMVESAGYRNFTNQQGKMIIAKVVEYNADTGRVRLELKNRKKAWVELISLSEADQAYILNLNTAPTSIAKAEKEGKPTVTPLSEDDVEGIAERFIDAILDQNYEAWKKLYFEEDKISQILFERAVKSGGTGMISPASKIKSIRIKEVEGNNVHLQLKTSSGYKEDGWLQLLPDGKIKYAPVVYPHPIPEAFKHAHRTKMVSPDNSQFATSRKRSVRRLEEIGIPLFGFDVGSPINDQLKALDKIFEWLEENGDEWDNLAPKLSCPEKQFKWCLKTYQ